LSNGLIAPALDMDDTALREIIERLQLALQAAKAGLFDRNLRTDEITFSGEQYRRLGLEPGSDVTYNAFRQRVHPDDRDRVDAITHEAITLRREVDVQYRFLLPDGTVRWLSSRGRAFFDDAGDPTRLIGITLDVTEQKRAQDLLRLQARVLDSMAEGVSVTTLDTGLILYTNPAEDRLFGYEPGGLIGKHVTEQNAYEPEDNQRIVSDVIQKLLDKGEWSGEWLNRRKDGSAFHSYARITTVEMDGRTYAVCVQEDTTKRRLEALDELLAALSGVLDIREVFERVSAIAKKVIPHDALSLPLLTDDKNHIVVYAITGDAKRFPETLPLPDSPSAARQLAVGLPDLARYSNRSGSSDRRLRARPDITLDCWCRSVSTPKPWARWISCRCRQGCTRWVTRWWRDVSPITSFWRCRTSGWPNKRDGPSNCALEKQGSNCSTNVWQRLPTAVSSQNRSTVLRRLHEKRSPMTRSFFP
jgi:PAS domain S-box-containing protein